MKLHAMSRATREAVAVTWDGCHKIYIIMDEGEALAMEIYGYTLTRGTGHEMAAAVQEWYAAACPLRFVAAVSSVAEYRTLIEQGA